MDRPTLESVTVESYRCFASAVTLQIRPITLLFGRNNAGKSALLRTLPLLAEACGGAARSPWNVERADGAGNGASFKDALWRGVPRRTMMLRLGWGGGGSGNADFKDEFRLRFDDDLDRTVIDRIKIEEGTDRIVFDGTSTPHSEYRVFETGGGIGQSVTFDGLVPMQHESTALAALAKRLQSLSGYVQWIKGVRHRTDRLISDAAARRLQMSPNGQEAASMVLASPDTLAAVNRFYNCDEVGRDLRGERAGSGFSRLFLDDPVRPNWRVELGDVGEGMNQVLPVLVALAHSRQADAPKILAVEDPDAHLHENARKALARHFVSATESDRDLRCIIETHSRTFLLGIQLAVASGQLKPEDVVIYWLDRQENGESVPLLTFLDAAGRPSSSVLQGALSEDERLVDELLEFQLVGHR